MTEEILYEVVIAVAPDARAAYLDWLRPHMREMLGFDGFLAAELYENEDAPGEYTCCYRLRDRAAMDAYLAGPASAMRADGIARFGDKISARRRILRRLGA